MKSMSCSRVVAGRLMAALFVVAATVAAVPNGKPEDVGLSSERL